MKTEIELNEMILEITNKIRERDPELLEFLNEMPITIPYQENPEITTVTLTSYYNSLVCLFEKYEENHCKNVTPNMNENLPITEIKTMEQDNAYQNLLTEANNTIISYYDIGEGVTPIIFLHGFPFNKSMWKGQIDFLKTTNRIIAIDIRGFGKSTDEESTLSIDLFSEDLLAFMDKLNIKKAIICGLSMGGFISLNAIKRFPDRFKALILCDTNCLADTAEIKKNRYKTIEQINIEGTTEFNEKFTKSVFHPDSIELKSEVFENLRSVVFANTKTIITAGLTALAERKETCSALENINVPTLIICGKQDEVTPLAQSEFLLQHIKNAQLKIIDNAGHVANLEQPEEFNKYIFDFLNSLETVSE